MKKLLLIEDDKIDQLAFKRFTDSVEFNYEVSISGSIEEAKQNLRDKEFEIIVSDYFLGDGTAFDILNDIKNIPMIIVTGTGDEEIAVKAIKMGAFDYLIKDLESNYLKMLPITVDKALKHFNAENELKKYHNNLEKLVKKRTEELNKEIIERKEKEKKLKESELKYRLLADYTYDFEYWMDEKGEYKYLSKSCEEITGYNYNEFLSNPDLLFDIIKPEYKQEVEKHYNASKGDKQNKFSLEFPIISKGGKEIWLEHNCFPVFDDQGNFAGRRGNNRNITEKKEANKKIEESVRRYRISAEATGDAYYRLNFKNMKYEYIHPNIAKLTGYLPSEVDFRKIVDVIEEGGKEVLIDDVKDRRKQGRKNRYQADYLMKMKNGEKKWISDVSFPIYNDNGEETGRYGVLSDITERKLMEKELVRSKEKAENADRMKSIFLAQMSHEIRTPINALVSMSSLLRLDFEEIANKDQLMSFDVIDRAGARIIRTVDLLLNLSEIQAGTYEKTPSRFDIVVDVISGIVAEYKNIAISKNIKLIIENYKVNSEVFADFYTVKQIFTQLIDNAIKFTEDGEVIVKICRNESEKIEVEIKDTGIGMDEQYLEKIFEPFSQEEMGYSRKFDGNGIGMALVKTYCKLNNAKIEVESKKGIGSTFKVTLD